MRKKSPESIDQRIFKRRDILSGAAVLALTGAGAAVATNSRSNKEMTQRELSENTEMDMGEKKVTEIYDLSGIEPIIGYIVEYKGIEVQREIDASIIDKFSLMVGENKLVATGDVKTDSKLYINPDKLSQKGERDEETNEVNLEISLGDLIVETYEQPNSRENVDVDGYGLAVKGTRAKDVILNSGETLEQAENDMRELTVAIARYQSNNDCVDEVMGNEKAIDLFKSGVTEKVLESIGIPDAKVVVKLVDDGRKPEVTNREEDEEAIRDLGGSEIISYGDAEELPIDLKGGA